MTRHRAALLTVAEIAALTRAAGKVLDEWEAYGDQPAGWSREELDALAAGYRAVNDAEPLEACPECGGKIRDGACRDCGKPW